MCSCSQSMESWPWTRTRILKPSRYTCTAYVKIFAWQKFHQAQLPLCKCRHILNVNTGQKVRVIKILLMRAGGEIGEIFFLAKLRVYGISIILCVLQPHPQAHPSFSLSHSCACIEKIWGGGRCWGQGHVFSIMLCCPTLLHLNLCDTVHIIYIHMSSLFVFWCGTGTTRKITNLV